MKKNIFYAFILFFIAFSILVFVPSNTMETQAASNTSLITNYLKYFKKKNYKKAKKYLKKMKKTDKDTSLKKMSKKQKKAYYKVVKKYVKKYPVNSSEGNYVWGYYLADLNKDKKPELLIQYGSCEADVRTVIYTYKKSKASKVKTFFSGHTGYIAYPGKGLLQIWAHMGSCSVSVMTMKKGKINVKNYGSQTTEKDYCLPNNYLDNHIDYNKNYKASVNYSDLK